MHRPYGMNSIRVRRGNRYLSPLAAFSLLSLMVIPVWGAQVRVRDGQAVRLKLRNILTTENVQTGDSIDFDVTEDILVSGHVVIAKGATAHGKILDVKGAGKPKAKDAEVIFQFTTVHAVDNQDIPLRLAPSKLRKAKSSENQVVERSPIPGYPSRLIGAEKGKDYVA